MKLLAELNDAMLGIGPTPTLDEKYTLRKSARVILLNESGKMAGQYLRTHNFHKLPGGGIDNGETEEDAAHREVLEEVGAKMKITQQLGAVIEYRAEYKLLHISYGFVGEVVGELRSPTLEEAEIAEGTETIWLSPEDFLAKMKADTPSTYGGHFILPREIAFMEEYLAGA